MDSKSAKPMSALKTKQISVRVSAAQELVLKQYCVRHGLSANTVILADLNAMIEGFEKI